MARNRTVNPAIPFIFVHGAIAGVVTDVATAMTFDHTHFRTSDFQFTNGDCKVILRLNANASGIYKIFACAGVEKKAGNPTILIMQLYVNGVACHCVSHGVVGVGAGHSDCVLIGAHHLYPGDYVEIYLSVDVGSATLEDDSARLMIEALPMEGWDNRHGGKKRLRGGL